MLIFPDTENAGNLVNLVLTQGKSWQHMENCVLVVKSLTCDVIVEFRAGKDGCESGGGNLSKKNTCY